MTNKPKSGSVIVNDGFTAPRVPNLGGTQGCGVPITRGFTAPRLPNIPVAANGSGQQGTSQQQGSQQNTQNKTTK